VSERCTAQDATQQLLVWATGQPPARTAMGQKHQLPPCWGSRNTCPSPSTPWCSHLSGSLTHMLMLSGFQAQALPDRLSRDSFCDAVCGSAVGKTSLSDIGGEVCTCAGGVGTLGLHTKLEVRPHPCSTLHVEACAVPRSLAHSTRHHRTVDACENAFLTAC
jgi:hypothetical protein